MTINLGDKARDQITGFEGVVTGKCTYITGCDQVLLAPPAKGGEYKDAHWYDVDRCAVLAAAYIRPEQVSSPVRPGPDKPAPIK